MSMSRDGGKLSTRDVYNYSPPVGPKNRHDVGPGLHSNNYGNSGTQGKTSAPGAETSGSTRSGERKMLPQGKH